jgi:hypothetical protein
MGEKQLGFPAVILIIFIILLGLTLLGIGTGTIKVPGGGEITFVKFTPIPVIPVTLVSPMAISVSPPVINGAAIDALTNYYSLVGQQKYDIAFVMLSEGYKNRNGITLDFYKSEWEKSGPASITQIIDSTETSDSAAVTIVLYYYRTDKQVYHTLRHYLSRENGCVDATFGCWQIMRVEDLSQPN